MNVFSIDPTLNNLHGHYSRDLEPILKIESGDRVVFRTLDAGWCEFGQPDPYSRPVKLSGRDRERDPGHALCGPIAVEGARAGMTLEIRFLKILPGAWGWSTAGGWSSAWNDRLSVTDGPEWIMRWKLDADRHLGTNQYGQTVRLNPFIGNIGMPPNLPGQHSTLPPRFCGGNIDCKELVEGTVLFLPIAVDGGLLSLGDGHGVQGDGEVSGVALECPMDKVEVEIHLHSRMEIPFPRAVTPTHWITFGFDEDLNEAAMIAIEGMLDWMSDLYDLERRQALAWASLIMDLRVTQVVNGARGVHAMLDRNLTSGRKSSFSYG